MNMLNLLNLSIPLQIVLKWYFIPSLIRHGHGKDASSYTFILDYKINSELILDGPAVQYTIIVPDFTTDGVVVQKVSPQQYKTEL